MVIFLQVLDDLAKQGLIDPEKDHWSRPEDWELTNRLKAAEEYVKKKRQAEEQKRIEQEQHYFKKYCAYKENRK